MGIKTDNGRNSLLNTLPRHGKLFDQEFKAAVQKVIEMVTKNPACNLKTFRFRAPGTNLQLHKKTFSQIPDGNTRRIKKLNLAQNSRHLFFADLNPPKKQTVNNHISAFSKVTVAIKITKNLYGNHHLPLPDTFMQGELAQQRIMKTVMLNRLKKPLLRAAFIGKVQPSFRIFSGKGRVRALFKRTFTEPLNRIKHIITIRPLVLHSHITGAILTLINQFKQRILLQLLINPLFKVEHWKLKKLTA